MGTMATEAQEGVLASKLDRVADTETWETPQRISTAISSEEASTNDDEWKSRIYAWDFDVHTFLDKNADMFTPLIMEILKGEGLLGWKIPTTVLQPYLDAVKAQYQENPYHSSAHAADVTQTVAVMLHMDARPRLTELEKFCLIMAATVHDLGHSGVNNGFLVASRHQWALLYNDASVNENMHISRAFMLAEDLGLFATLTQQEYTQIRKLMIDAVLATDMAGHFELVKKFQTRLDQQPDAFSWEDRSVLLQMMLHVADLCNPARELPIAIKWAEMIVTEFELQGELEKALGMPVTPMCVPHQDLAKLQLDFIPLFVAPTLDLFAAAMPNFVSMCRQCLERTLQHWRADVERRKSFSA